jgi:hypothetical protein
MRIVRAALLLALLAGPAYAQAIPGMNIIPEDRKRTPEELERDAKTDKAYRESLGKIPNAKPAADPWGNVRGSDAPKAAQPKPRAKSANSPN